MMTKKTVFLAVLMAAAGSALFALDLSFGAGIWTGATANKMSSEDKNITVPAGMLYPFTGQYLPVIATPAKIALNYTVNDNDIGGFFFVDCEYAELTLGYLCQVGTVSKITTPMVSGDPQLDSFLAQSSTQGNKNYVSHLFNIDVLGKYPVAMSEQLTLFPALGLMFRIPVGGNENSDYKHEANWGLGIKLGGGMDLHVSEHVYIRGELLCYFELAADKEINVPEYADQLSVFQPENGTAFTVKSEGYYIQPQVKLAVGYKL
ncbi:MAG: hypothetical protein LBT01_08475 [Spirochaetaceae bacterium]|nr:hypothetical protein [Spirochaetaceae bacterium]